MPHSCTFSLSTEGEPVNPEKPDPFENYYTEGGAAIGVVVAGVLGSLGMILAAVFFANQWNRYFLPRS